MHVGHRVVPVAEAQQRDRGHVRARALAADEQPVGAELRGAVLEQPHRDGFGVVVARSGTSARAPSGTRGSRRRRCTPARCASSWVAARGLPIMNAPPCIDEVDGVDRLGREHPQRDLVAVGSLRSCARSPRRPAAARTRRPAPSSSGSARAGHLRGRGSRRTRVTARRSPRSPPARRRPAHTARDRSSASRPGSHIARTAARGGPRGRPLLARRGGARIPSAHTSTGDESWRTASASTAST